MTPLGDRVKVHGAMRTLGLIARRDGVPFAITSQDCAVFEAYREAGMELSADRLVRALPLDELPRAPRHEAYSIGALANIDRLIDVTVRRFHPSFGRIQGRVTSLRGAVRMNSAGKCLIAHGLVEVTFDQQDSDSGTATPVLESGDSGALVTSWDGRVVGVLVGGSNHIGYVAPLAEFLRKNELVHQIIEPNAGLPWEYLGRHTFQKQAGIASFGAELAREESMGLDDIPEAA
jgi:hypothetical protein